MLIFYYLIRKFSKLDLDYKDHSNRIISRRALNRILKLRGNWSFLLANLSESSYPTSHLVVDIHNKKNSKSFSDQIRFTISILISRTNLFNKLFIYIFLISSIFSFAVIVNALLVRYKGYDIFGVIREYVPGWTFIVIFTAITFNILLVSLYFLYIYLSTIATSVQRNPLYTIESIDKF